MKKNKYNIKLVALFMTGFLFSSAINAQNPRNAFINVDWQFNLPLNDFANTFSGWGANIESGYYITDNIALGGFLSYHTNQEYIERQTLITSESSAVTSDQQHSLFQIPFGVATRYTFAPEKKFTPYVGLKLGANYAKMSSHMNIFRMSEKSWGFHISPEIGTNLYVDPENKFAIHFATYYSFSSNKDDLLVYSLNGINNFGVRVGIGF